MGRLLKQRPGTEPTKSDGIGRMVAVAIIRKGPRLCVLRQMVVEDGIVTSFTDGVEDSRDICLSKAEEALINATDR